MHSAIFAENGLFRVALVLLVCLAYNTLPTHSELVILNFQHGAAGGPQLKLCALKKSVSNGAANNNPLGLIDLKREDGCRPLDEPADANFSQSALYVHMPKTNCPFSKTIENIQMYDPSLVLVGSDGPIALNASIVNLTASYIFFPDAFAQQLNNFISQYTTTNLTVTMNSDLTRFDLSLLVIWLIAVLTIILGAQWTDYEFIKSMAPEKKKPKQLISFTPSHELLYDENGNRAAVNPMANESNLTDASTNTVTQLTAQHETNKPEVNKKNSTEQDKNITIQIGYLSIFMLLVFVVGMLLMLYFFYNVMIYFIFLIFCFGATTAFYRIGCLAFDQTKFLSCTLPKCKLPYFRSHDIEVRRVILAMASLTLTIVWFVYRHEKWSWLLQNLMALSLAANALSIYRLSAYKTAALILGLFFAYDIFMVFVTPTFTKGTSIMEAVAFGGRDNEPSADQDWNNLQFGAHKDTLNRLPVVVIIPHLSQYRRLCEYYYDFSFSLLGLGDILVPGLSVNYAIIFDRAAGVKYNVYFVVNVIGYLTGLLLAFAGLLFMNTAQPALFYLCPILISFSVVTALVRREFGVFWSGSPISDMIKRAELANEQLNETTTNVNTTVQSNGEDQQISLNMNSNE